jgi:hypothetical protein
MVRTTCRRRGLGRLEAVVLALASAVAVGLLLPAGLRAQKARGQTACQFNIKQILLATHNYGITYGGGVLPAVASAPLLGSAWVNDDNRYSQSFFFTLLPFLEQAEIYKAGYKPTTLGKTWMGQVPAGPVYAHAFVKSYVCPDDPTNSASKTTACGWVGVSYACNYQVFGTHEWGSVFNLGNIPDGASNTVFIAERFAQFPGPAGRFTDPDGKEQQANNLWAWPAAYAPNPPTAYKTPVPQNAAVFAYGDPDKEVGYGKAAFGVPQVGIAPARADYRLVQSAHAKSVQVGMGDGSVHPVTAGISPKTWQAAVLPADGMPLGNDW